MPAQKPRRAPDIALIVLLALLPLLFFWRLITPNPADQMNVAAGDFGEQYFPLRAFAAGEWVAGRIPLWNPFLYGGQPALADIQSGALYPLHLLQALLLGWGGPLFGLQIGFPLKALEWQAVLHFSLAAVGAYLFGRCLLLRLDYRLRLARLGGVVLSLAFTYSGYLTGFPVQQLTILEVSAWLPWIMLGLTWAGLPLTPHPSANGNEASRQRRGEGHITRAIWPALAFALALLAGHPQTVLYIFYLTLAYTLLLTFVARQQGVRLWPPLAVWLLMVLLGSGLAAMQLLPTLEFIGQSVRADLSYPAVSAGLPLTELVTLLYPGFFGGSPAYVGVVTLALAALAPLLGWAQWRSQQRAAQLAHLLFWSGAALFSLLLAFGNNLFLFSAFYLFAPGFESVRQQERVFLLFSFSMAVLAAFGAAMLAGPVNRPVRQALNRYEMWLRRVALGAFFVTGLYIYGATASTARGDAVNLFYGVLWHHLLGLLLLAGLLVLLALRPRRWLRRGWALALLAAWLAFNLFTVNWRFNLAPPAEVPQFVPDGITQFLQAQVGAAGRISSGGLLPGGNSAASVYGLEDLTGNTPLQLARMEQFLAAMPSWRLWQLMNVQAVVDQRQVGDAGLLPQYAEGDITVYQMADPFERAWLVGSVEVIGDDAQAIARLADDGFDLRGQAVVPQPMAATLAPAGQGSVQVQKISPTRLELAVSASGEQLLVVSQVFYPGWHATVDDVAAELVRVNVVQQGVVVPPGDHTVQLYFWPRSFQAGLLVSLLAALVWGGLLGLSCWRRGR